MKSKIELISKNKNLFNYFCNFKFNLSALETIGVGSIPILILYY